MSDTINFVKPFAALHYNPEVIRNIGLCLSQPYDVINPEQLDRYLKQHENNITRLTLPKITALDTDSNNRYTRAHDTLRQWINSNVLREAGHPSFWAYEQEFRLPQGNTNKVRGFIGLVRLQDYEEMRILPHEKVLKKPVEDRIKLTKTTNAQFEYIWGVYRDKKSVIDKILRECDSDQPIVDFDETEMKVKHRFWRISDENRCADISSVMSGCKIYIADGHHRYQTMLTIRDEYRALYPDAGPDAPWEYIMMFLTNSEHEGLTILPTHRMLHDLEIGDWSKAITKIEKFFRVERLGFNSHNEPMIRDTWLANIQKVNNAEKKFGLFLRDSREFLILTLKDEKSYESIVPAGNSIAWMMLDVNIVNYLLLKEAFSISEEELALGEKIKYAVDPNEAVEKVASGTMDAAIILNSTKLEQVLTIADNREIMPRKSTFFYPKPLSGLVMYNMNR